MTLPTTIKALQNQPDKTVKVVEIPFADQDKVKNLPANEVLVKIRAVALNPTDWKHSIGPWGEPGNVVGCDAAGDVVKVGSAVKHIHVGDRVFGFAYGTTQPDNGAFAEYARFNANASGVVPAHLSYAEAAALPIPHLTAVQFLYFRLRLPLPSAPATDRPNFVVWGGSSGLGHHAVQLAKLSGFRVITTASKKNHEFLKSIGADVVIDYHDADVAQQLKDAIKDGGLKYALDAVTEPGTTNILIDLITDPHGHIVTSLPIGPEVTSRRPEVKVEFHLVYTLITDKAFKFAKVLDIALVEEDHAQAQKWVSTELPKILEGWVEGKGSPRYKSQQLRVGHGLDKIHEGLEYLRDGKVSSEKLVYII